LKHVDTVVLAASPSPSKEEKKRKERIKE